MSGTNLLTIATALLLVLTSVSNSFSADSQNTDSIKELVAKIRYDPFVEPHDGYVSALYRTICETSRDKISEDEIDMLITWVREEGYDGAREGSLALGLLGPRARRAIPILEDALPKAKAYDESEQEYDQKVLKQYEALDAIHGSHSAEVQRRAIASFPDPASKTIPRALAMIRGEMAADCKSVSITPKTAEDINQYTPSDISAASAGNKFKEPPYPPATNIQRLVAQVRYPSTRNPDETKNWELLMLLCATPSDNITDGDIDALISWSRERGYFGAAKAAEALAMIGPRARRAIPILEKELKQAKAFEAIELSGPRAGGMLTSEYIEAALKTINDNAFKCGDRLKGH